MVLKDTANDRRHLALCHDEFRRPRSGLCRSGGIGNNNSNNKLAIKTYLAKGPDSPQAMCADLNSGDEKKVSRHHFRLKRSARRA
ncbi:hypothetical protein TNCV_1732351 [Trichonephila clavipes]|nr:hypothetical protein TNCV_1732351 [Trichonephila clavipes]